MRNKLTTNHKIIRTAVFLLVFIVVLGSIYLPQSPFSNIQPAQADVAFHTFAISTPTTATTTFTIPIPATIAAGEDLYVLFVSRDHTSGTALATLVDNDSGGNSWTRIGGSTNRKLNVFWKKATSGTASKTITVAGCVGSCAGGLSAYTGGAAGNPTTNFVVEDNASGDETHAGFTPDNGESFIVFGVVNDTNDIDITLLNSANLGTLEPEQWAAESTGGSDTKSTLTGIVQAGVAAATGNFTWAQTNATTHSVSWAIKGPQTFEQSGYRFFENSGTTSVSNVLADANTAATTATITSQFRLRMLLHIGGQNLSISGQAFKLQYAAKVDATCADDDASNESWADVTASSTGIAYNDNGTPADGDNLTENATDDPTHSGHTNVAQDYEELNNFTNSVGAINAGQDGLWDFSLKWNSASSNTAYCIKAVKSDASALNTYTYYPEISTPADYTLNQVSYRWRNDDGNEDTATGLTKTLHPTSQGTYTGWTATAGCTENTAEWDCVNDQTANAGEGTPEADDGDTSMLQTLTGGARSSFHLDDALIPANATQIEIFMRGAEVNATGGNATITAFYRLNSADTDCGTAGSFGGTAYSTQSCVFTGPFTPTDLDNMEIGVLFGANDPKLTQVYVVVTYDTTAATWKQAENTPHTDQAKSENLRLRVLVKNDGPDATGSLNYRLQYARQGTGSCAAPEFAYAAVPATTGEVIRASTSYYADQVSSTNVSGAVTDPSGTFIAGKLVEDPNNDAQGVSLSSTEFTEIEYAIQFTSSAVNDAVYCFRVAKNNSAFTGTYNYAEITIAGAGITISGSCVQSNQSTVCSDAGANHKIRVAVNGTLKSQVDDTVDGSWSIGAVSGATTDSIITIFIEGEASSASQAVAVTKYSGAGDIASVELIESHLTIGSDQNNTISNTELGSYDSSVSGKRTFHDNSGTTLTVDADSVLAGEELYITAGDSYQPGGTVNTHDLEILGTFTPEANAVNVSGTWDNNGTFTAGSSTVTMSGTSETLDASTFNNLTIDSGSTITASGSFSVSGTLNSNAGALSIPSGVTLTHSGSTLTLSGTISGSGTLQETASGFTFPTGGTISTVLVMNTTNGNQTLSQRTYGGQVIIDNSGATTGRTVTLGTAGSQTLTFSGGLDIAESGTGDVLLTGASNNPTVNITGSLTCSSGTLNNLTTGSGTWTTSNGVNFTNCNTVTTTGGTIALTGGTLTSNGKTLNNLDLSSGSITLAAATHTVSGNLTLGGTLTTTGSTITMTGTSNTITGGGSTLANLTIDPSSAGTITMQTSDLTVTGQAKIATGDTFSIQSGRTLTLSGSGTPLLLFNTSVFSPNSTATVSYTGTSATTIAPASYGNLALRPAGTATYTLASASAQTIGVNGKFTLGNGTNAVTATAATFNPTINYFGDVEFKASSLYASGSGTSTFKNGAGQTFTDNTAAKQNLGEIRISANGTDTTLTLGSDIKVSSLSIDASQTLDNSTRLLTITGSGNVFTNNGIFKPGTGTVQYTGTSAAITPTKYKNLTLGGTGSYQLPASGTTTLLGDLTLTSGATVASGSATLLFRGGTTQTITDNTTGKMNLGELAIMASTGGNTTLTLATDVRIASATIDSSQTLDNGTGRTLTITNSSTPLTVAGTFTRSTGTVAFTGNGATSIPTLDFYNLKLQPASGSFTYTLASGTASVSNMFSVGNGFSTLTVDANTNSTGLDVRSASISEHATLIADDTAEFTLSGNFGNRGTFTPSGGTVTFEGPATATISGYGNNLFHNLTIATPGKKIKFMHNRTFNITGTLTANGTSGNNIQFTSNASGSTQWLINFTNPQSAITYATVKNGGCAPGSATVTHDATVIDNGGNGTCWFTNPLVKNKGGSGGGNAYSFGGGSGGGQAQGGGQSQNNGGGPSGSGGQDGGGTQQTGGEGDGESPTSGGGSP